MTPPVASIRIVRAGAEHAELLAPLFDAYRLFYRQASDVAGARVYLAERLSRNEAVVFLALEGSAALGFSLLFPSFTSLAMKPIWILNDLYVVPEARRRGVAQALMAAASQLAVETGAVRLTLETGADNFIAQRLYERLGWQRETGVYHYTLAL
jgi:GNAT superfamily N-acetyltransferase